MKKVSISVLSLICLIAASLLFISPIDEYDNIIYNFSEETFELDAADANNEYNITALIQFNYSLPAELKDISADTSDEELSVQNREKRIEFFEKKNILIAEKLDLNDYLCYIGGCAPFVELSFESLNDFNEIKDILERNIRKSSDVALMSINLIKSQDSAYANKKDYDKTHPFTFENAKNAVGISGNHSDNTILIGMCESGDPDEGHSNFTAGDHGDEDANLHLLNSNPQKTAHATVVASIMGGYNGIASNSIICTHSISNLYPQQSFFTAVDALIRDGSYLINISYGISGDYGIYDHYAAFLDYVIYNHGCTIIIAAGNSEEGEDHKINNIGMSRNGIAVGSIDNNMQMSYFSSYIGVSHSDKPDFVAPGGGLVNIPNISTQFIKQTMKDDTYTSLSGTSFSTPMVTGVTALLMGEYTNLRTTPAILKAVLHNSCEYISIQHKFFDTKAGYGVVKYNNARDILANGRYRYFEIRPDDTVNEILVSQQIYIPVNNVLKLSLNSIIPSSVTTLNNIDNPSAEVTPIFSKLKIRIKKVNESTVLTEKTLTSNSGYFTYVNTDPNSNGNYTIEIILAEDNIVVNEEKCAFAYTVIPHTHRYSERYTSTALKHTGTCICGATNSTAHVIDLHDTGRFRLCIDCGRLVDTGDGGVGVLSNLSKSENGSYILPNGIAVLALEDYEAYYNGTLVFYKNDHSDS